MLDPTQEFLLRTLTEATHDIAATDREPFVVSGVVGRPRYVSISHPRLPEPLESYRGDVIALEHADLIRVYDREATVSFVFDVTPLGFARAISLDGVAGTAVARAEMRRWGRWLAVGEAPFKTSNMSALWRVRDETDLSRSVRVLKTLRYAKGRGSAAFRRFTREIEILGFALQGQHSGIIEVLDFSLPSEGDTREAYYVMPMASGSLKDLARDINGEVAPVLRKLIPIADALATAHAAGVIHRDIKPDNILLFDGEPVLADFGICYLEEEDRLTRTEAHTVGTDDFVAPELLGGGRAGTVGPAVDVYSFAKTIFAVVSGGDVFPRERHDDERYDLVARFGRPELAHVRGLIERMVTEDPAARPQSMAEVSALLKAALANVEERIPYREGMYAGTTHAVARARHLRRLLANTTDRQRRDAVRTELAEALSATMAGVDAHLTAAHGAYTVRPDEASARAAAAAAEEMIAIGLPLVELDDRDGFAEWLGAVFEPSATRDGNQNAGRRLILEPGAVLAAHAAGGLAWRLRRFELLRQIVERYLSNPSLWIHHRILGNNATELVPWITQSMMTSEMVRNADVALADDPRPPVSMLNGLVALRLLVKVDTQAFAHFMAQPEKVDNPLPFAPGFIDLTWVQELVAIGLRGGPIERELGQAIFDFPPEAFRKMCGRLGPQVQFMSHYAMRQLGRVPYFSMGIDPRDWERWTGSSIPN